MLAAAEPVAFAQISSRRQKACVVETSHRIWLQGARSPIVAVRWEPRRMSKHSSQYSNPEEVTVVSQQPLTRNCLHQCRYRYRRKIGERVRHGIRQDDLVAMTHCAAGVNDVGHVTLAFRRLGAN